jgi:hypothetical protein
VSSVAYAFIGFETKGRTIEQIDAQLAADRQQREAAALIRAGRSA